MFNKKKITRLFVMILPSLFLPFVLFAGECVSGDGSCYTITNPVSNQFGDGGITSMLGAILRSITIIAIPVMVVAFIYSGFKFVKSQGSAAGIEDAKRTFGYTILGALLILGSNVIYQVISVTAEQVMGK
jgi:hypothetical protein